MKKYLLPAILLLSIISCTEKVDLSQLPSIGTTNITRVYSEENRDHYDRRLTTIRAGRDFPYEMPKYEILEQWQERADELRTHILVTTGLWPMPEKCPLNAHVYDKIERDDYTVEKVYFESYPGFFVTGNLYRPRGKEAPFPGIISPHGHWKSRLENSEKNSIPGRAINFAKQGYVILTCDMIGYGDSKQLSHKFADSRIHQAWGINLLGLQLWNSIRALDFLTSLADVDSSRIGVTGASGGGTQTFMVTAVDKRIKCAAPVNMISAHFQGGCLCENAPSLRLNTFNVEIAALAAPRPLLMVAASGDWTKNTPTVEYPMVQSIYRLYGALDKVYSQRFDYPHNYNRDSRQAVYAWFAKWLLNDDNSEKYREKPFTVEKDPDLLNFPGDQQPPGDLDETKMTEFLQNHSRLQLNEFWPQQKSQIKRFREIYGPALEHVLAVEYPPETESASAGTFAGSNYAATRLLISGAGKEDWIPALLFEPQRKNKTTVLMVHPNGKQALVGKNGRLDDLIATRLSHNKSVLLIDVFRTGEHVLPDGVDGRDESIDHFTTFNKTDLMERVQDIVTAAAFLKQANRNIELVGLEQAGLWVTLAASQLSDIDLVDADFGNTDLGQDTVFEEALFAPGLAKAGHMLTAAALAEAKRINFYNLHRSFPVERLSDYFRLAGKSFDIFEGEIK